MYQIIDFLIWYLIFWCILEMHIQVSKVKRFLPDDMEQHIQANVASPDWNESKYHHTYVNITSFPATVFSQ